MLMQQIWLEKLDWNDSLSTFLFHKWSTFLKYFSNIRAIQIPRWVNFVTIGDVHFQCFCDASEKAFATDIYIRIRVSDSIHTYLLTAKSKVAPIKVVSLPRLELCGAVLMAEMADVILPELGIDQYDSFFWTDSTIVLACLRKSPCQWSTFVANRVSTIVEYVGQVNWFHVDTHKNPSDFATRGVSPQDLDGNDLWWKGPDFISKDTSQ